MAFNIFWKIKFKSLRAGTDYTVNIWKDGSLPSGYPLTLKGGAQPFTTQEDDDDDMFAPVRTHSGYIRIVDDGKAINYSNSEVSFNWKELLPETDTDRPVTLTHVENGATVVDWQGTMQAQNFGGGLYGNPQERDFPIQCPLTVASREYVSTSVHDIKNFSYLLLSVLNAIPEICRPSRIVIQGGIDAKDWMTKQVDWLNFIEQDDENNATGKYDYGTVLEDLCYFWGFTARTSGTTMYLTCVDDADETNALVLTYAQLQTLASGTDAGTVEAMFGSTVAIGNIFASTDNFDYKDRGPDTAIVRVNPNNAPTDVVDPIDSKLMTDMNGPDWYDGYFEHDGDNYWHYTEDILSVSRLDLTGTCTENYAAFNILQKYNGEESGYSEVGGVIHIKKTYDGTTCCHLETKYEHCFSNGFFRFFADTYRMGEKYENVQGSSFAGNPAMKMRFAIGHSLQDAKYWDGQAWQDEPVICQISIGNRKPEMFTRYGSLTSYTESSIIATNNLSGRIYIDLLGTDDIRVDNINGEKCFDLQGFRVEYNKNDNTTKQQFTNSGWYEVKQNTNVPSLVYKVHNSGMTRNDYNVDCVYGGNDGSEPGYGLLMNADGSYMSTASYDNGQQSIRPEQHLADRVVAYWETSKRRIECDLLVHDGSAATSVSNTTPRSIYSLDGSTLYPVAVQRNWVDDVIKIYLLELNT